ncbi:MAG: hypothetical protein P8H13_08930 [Polaribacter sp.]|nr:hypothetical protein [Polaribacter sp.]MDG1812045.1 hypothetical protein [Polaribacter sp.]MDG1993077.1 hypothetical protein [Polaribacter sp.]
MDEKEKNIKKWILKNGYPFEMKVANLFKKNEFNVSQSILYKDNVTNKYREIDIIAHTSREINGVWFNLTYVIECKKTTDKPWVVFKNKDLFNLQSNRYKNFGSKNAEILFSKIKKKIQSNKNLKFIFPSIIDSGYNIVTAFKDSKDLAYSATNGLLSACEYLVKRSNDSKLQFCNMYIPIIAIEGDLYESYLNPEGELTINSVDSSAIVNTKSFDDNNSSIITITTSNRLNNFVNKLNQNNEFFFNNFVDEMKEISISKPSNGGFVSL